jgi:uncharacterized membrane protein YdjX (TVP38/TMEM64 family)
MQSHFAKRLYLCLRIAVVLAICILVGRYHRELRSLDISLLVGNAANLFWAIGAIWFIYSVKATLFVIPAMLLYLSVGALFSKDLAILISSVGIAVEVMVSYCLGRFLGGGDLAARIGNRRWGRQLLELQKKRNMKYLFYIRAVPAFPIDFTSLFCGSIRIPFWRYFFVSLAGLYPRVFF